MALRWPSAAPRGTQGREQGAPGTSRHPRPPEAAEAVTAPCTCGCYDALVFGHMGCHLGGSTQNQVNLDRLRADLLRPDLLRPYLSASEYLRAYGG